MDAARALIREPDVANARQYRRRVQQLAAIYVSALALACIGIVLLIVYGRLFVSLSQRSNVETLTIVFFILFLAYVGLLSTRGAWGGARLLCYWLWGRLSADPDAIERKKIRRLGAPCRGASVALNRTLERSDRPGEPFEVAIADRIAPVGRIRVDGVKVRLLGAHRAGSNDLLAYFVRQVTEILQIDDDELEVVCWAAIDEEGWHEYVGLVEAMRNLGRRSGDGTSVWPSLMLSPPDCAVLEQRMAAICGPARNEGFLPQLEFEGEHKIPIIPEPLGIISLSRRERRVDPLSSLGAAFLVIAAVVALLIWFILRPPWVPGT